MRRDRLVVGVDTGGTFTDVFLSDGRVLKLPSTPIDPVDAIVTALERMGVGPGDAVGHGTTVATNAVLQRRGARTVLVTTAGFEDVLEIRRQNRPQIYDLNARWPEPLVGRAHRLGVHERLDWEGNVIEPLTPDALDDLARAVMACKPESVAICLLFSYANSNHEALCVATVARALGGRIPVSASCRVAPRIGEYERSSTTVVNAYVTPVMREYLEALRDRLAARGLTTLHVMQSNGGLVGAGVAADLPVSTVLSGPAAGVIGAAAVARDVGRDEVITFDMGGTSTDVAVVPGTVVESDEGEIESFPLQIPMLAIETVGAGGGSIARIDAAGVLHVGPESAGADPGPAAYGISDLPTVTDANLVLGRLSSRGLLAGAMPLDVGRARQALQTIARPLGLSVEQSAWAVVRLANSNMERAVRAATLRHGHDPRRFTLVAFGGAGPLHGAELAEQLGTDSMLVPPHPGVMAALGLTVPDLVRDYGRTVLLPLEERSMPALRAALQALATLAQADVEHEDLFEDPVLAPALDIRYAGQAFHLRIPHSDEVSAVEQRFTEAYRRRYGHAPADARLEIVNARLRVTLPRRVRPQVTPPWPEAPPRPERRTVWFGTHASMDAIEARQTEIVWRPSLAVGTEVRGPAVLEQYDTTTLLPNGWRAQVDARFNLCCARVEL